MKILHVAQPVDAGVAHFVATVAADQLSRGWDVTVAAPPSGGHLARDLATAGVRQEPWAAVRAPGLDVPGEIRQLARIVSWVEPDVVHLHSAKAGLAGRLALRGRLPTIVQPNGWSWLAAVGAVRAASMRWERFASRWARLTVCVSEGERELAVRAGVRGRLVVVRNAVDLTHFAPASDAARAAARGDLGVAADTPLAVCIGRLARQKGQDLLFDAWPEVRAAVPEARLVLVGDGELREQLARRAPAGVLLAGQVPDPRAWYAAADVVVSPSRWEGMSFTVLEALASGCPVVATDVPGSRDVLDGGEPRGEVVAVGHRGELVRALLARLGDLARAREEGAAAGRFAAEQLGRQRQLDSLAVATEDLLAAPHGSLDGLEVPRRTVTPTSTRGSREGSRS